MIDYERILKVHDFRGNLSGVMIRADIWAEIENLLSARIATSYGPREDLSGFKDLMQAWNFRYPYDPAVQCPKCGSQTPDWSADEPRVFNLVSGSLSGLLVFRCAKCGATVRHKYFKDHMTVESSSPDDQA